MAARRRQRGGACSAAPKGRGRHRRRCCCGCCCHPHPGRSWRRRRAPTSAVVSEGSCWQAAHHAIHIPTLASAGENPALVCHCALHSAAFVVGNCCGPPDKHAPCSLVSHHRASDVTHGCSAVLYTRLWQRGSSICICNLETLSMKPTMTWHSPCTAAWRVARTVRDK